MARPTAIKTPAAPAQGPAGAAAFADGVFTAPFIDHAAGAAALAGGMRVARDRMLSASDWTQVADTPISDADKASWTAYRKLLRDVPTQAGFPDTVVWPVTP